MDKIRKILVFSFFIFFTFLVFHGYVKAEYIIDNYLNYGNSSFYSVTDMNAINLINSYDYIYMKCTIETDTKKLTGLINDEKNIIRILEKERYEIEKEEKTINSINKYENEALNTLEKSRKLSSLIRSSADLNNNIRAHKKCLSHYNELEEQKSVQKIILQQEKKSSVEYLEYANLYCKNISSNYKFDSNSGECIYTLKYLQKLCKSNNAISWYSEETKNCLSCEPGFEKNENIQDWCSPIHKKVIVEKINQPVKTITATKITPETKPVKISNTPARKERITDEIEDISQTPIDENFEVATTSEPTKTNIIMRITKQVTSWFNNWFK